jgi:hypothetical protein
MPNSPSLLVMYASFLIEARKDGQASRTQLQLAQKASPSLLDNYAIYVTQQLAKQLKRGKPTQHSMRPHGCLHAPFFHPLVHQQCYLKVCTHVSCADGDGLDLMSYVEFQRNYLACVRAHKAALMTQRTFWNSLLKDNISFRDLQVRCKVTLHSAGPRGFGPVHVDWQAVLQCKSQICCKYCYACRPMCTQWSLLSNAQRQSTEGAHLMCVARFASTCPWPQAFAGHQDAISDGL